MQSIELAWAAGFYDGEGCTGVSTLRLRPGKGRSRMVLTMEVNQVDERPLQRFAAAVGCGSITRRTAPRNARWQQQSRWRAVGGTAELALVRLLPYLSEPKREQAERAIERAYAHYCMRTAVGAGAEASASA